MSGTLRGSLRNVLAASFWAVALAALPSSRQREEHSADARDAITFYAQVQPILFRHCVRCHQPNGVAPMSLNEFEEARPWASSIEVEVAEGRMPPWFADPGVGRFRNDARLPAEDRDTILEWVRSGAPAGTRAKVPLEVEPREEWQIGTPDLVVEMPVPFQVPATGKVDYIYVRLPLPNEEDRWVAAVEVLPGQRSVIHHVDVFLCPEGCEEFASLEHGVPSFLPLSEATEPPVQDDVGGWFGLETELLYSYLPGGDPWVLPHGRGRLLPARGEVVLNLHYTPNGIAVLDRTRVGVVFASETPDERVITIGVDNETLWIPAAAVAHRASARVTTAAEMRLLALTPHMHFRGRSFAFEAQFPDGSRRSLLRVPRWDFNWQLTYVLEEPLALPAGTVIVSEAVFDNSRGNRFNPDSTRDVPWGRQVTDEMMTAWVEVALPAETDGRSLFQRVTAR